MTRSLDKSVGRILAAALLPLCLLAGLLMACAKTPKVVRDLPELPPEFARDLAPAGTAPVLMTKPTSSAKAAVPRSPSQPPQLAVGRACTTVWKGYVIYPMTVCYPPSEQVSGLELQNASTLARRGDASGVLPVRYFKLTSHPQARIVLPWFCSVRGGPWYAEVQGKQFCGANPNIRAFTAVILGAPEPVVVTWTGALTDVPPPLQLPGIAEAGESCVCCSGVTCPDDSCKPNFNLCGTMPPALK